MRAASRLVLLLPLLLGVTVPAAAKTPRKVCKATCAPLVTEQCSAFKKKKTKRCRARLWKRCQRDRISCDAPATTTTLPTTSTTLPPSAPGCATTFVVGPEFPGGAEHVATGDLNA